MSVRELEDASAHEEIKKHVPIKRKEKNSDYQVGDEILVKSQGYDKKGRLNLSRKEAMK